MLPKCFGIPFSLRDGPFSVFGDLFEVLVSLSVKLTFEAICLGPEQVRFTRVAEFH